MKQICDFKIANYIERVKKDKDEFGKDKAYMLIAHLASLNSLDPHSKTGACIVSKDGELVSIGWNAMPFDGAFSWEREGLEEETKYPYVVHAERMAIYNAIIEGKVDKLKGASIYVNLFPCNQCMQQIALYELDGLYYDSDKYHDSLFTKEARIIIDKLQKNRKSGFKVKQINVSQELDKYQKLGEEENEKVNC